MAAVRLPPPRALARRLSLPCSLSLLISCLSPCLSETKAGAEAVPAALREPSGRLPDPPSPAAGACRRGGEVAPAPPPPPQPPTHPLSQGKVRKRKQPMLSTCSCTFLAGRGGGGWFGAGVRAAASPGGAGSLSQYFSAGNKPTLGRAAASLPWPFLSWLGSPWPCVSPPPFPWLPKTMPPRRWGCRQGAREGGWMVVLQSWG